MCHSDFTVPHLYPRYGAEALQATHRVVCLQLRLTGSAEQRGHKEAFVPLPLFLDICRDVKSRGFTGKPLCCMNMGIVPVHAWPRLGKGTNAVCPRVKFYPPRQPNTVGATGWF